VTLAALAAALAIPAAALADDAVVPPVEPPPNPNTVPLTNPVALFGPKPAFATTFGFGRIGGSWYFQLDPYLQMDFGKFGFAVQVPLDLLSPLPHPNTGDWNSAYGHVVRREDFPPLNVDTYGHYLALIRMIRWGEPGDPFYLQYGQFYGETIGHGTVVDRYDNVLDPNNSKPGLAIGVDLKDYGTLELFTDNIAWPATELLAGRIAVRPLGIAGMGDWARKWAVGLTFADDRTAPEAPLRESCPPVCTGAMAIAPTLTRPAMVVGIDTDYRVLDTSVVALTPYVDLNDELAQVQSWGLHIGVLGRFAIPVANAVRLWARLEYRLMQPGYIPDYFGPLYDVQRFAYPVSPALTTAQASAALLLAPHGPEGLTHLQHGIYGEATVDVLHLVQAGATFSAIPAVPESGNLMVFASLPSLGPVTVSAYYLHQNFETAKEFFRIDDRSSLSGVIMFDVFGPLWVLAAITRSWVASTGADGVVSYEPVTTESFGVETYLPF
jgi:hypothetical protein